MSAVKITWKDTLGLASASQLVNKTFSPVVVSDVGTAPRQERKLTITRVVESPPVKRSKEVKFSPVKRRKAAKKKLRGSKKP